MKVTQSCLSLYNPINCIVLGILQARIVEWVVFPFSRGSSQPRNQTNSPVLQVDSLPTELWGEPHKPHSMAKKKLSRALSQVFLQNRIQSFSWLVWFKFKTILFNGRKRIFTNSASVIVARMNYHKDIGKALFSFWMTLMSISIYQ